MNLINKDDLLKQINKSIEKAKFQDDIKGDNYSKSWIRGYINALNEVKEILGK